MKVYEEKKITGKFLYINNLSRSKFHKTLKKVAKAILTVWLL